MSQVKLELLARSLGTCNLRFGDVAGLPKETSHTSIESTLCSYNMRVVATHPKGKEIVPDFSHLYFRQEDGSLIEAEVIPPPTETNWELGIKPMAYRDSDSRSFYPI